MELNKIAKWLDKNGLKYEIVHWRISRTKHTDAIMVDNDYEGLYAPTEVYYILNKVRNYIRRYHSKFSVEPCGCYTGILIIDRNEGEM